ncbi:inositol phosphorylceramide synthase [Altererythrobacter aurantiacus]|uniref:Inositol phosphorylceramide synthase n=1 Tax=Parapontixanthobacter aurantiacus TaxID=1463599 RepID=A0A844ZC19_9SPHN|nr:phosphatase PAP2 family protein [Parapontixanthobacter aurantiacus]MXO84812.1 inositol phosphorylceramide synthase [Parapontixanthobacter aurantiacus]
MTQSQKPTWLRFELPVEVVLALAFLTVTLAVGLLSGLPFSLPNSERASFVGIHYLYPLIAIAIWGVTIMFSPERKVSSVFFTALPAYALVLVCHFNLKLWIPHLNGALWDDFFWRTDEAVRPVVDAAMAIRSALDSVIALDGNFYMIGFIAMFYLVFIFVSFRRSEDFRELMVAIICLQILGSIGYLLTPALGPFLYEVGVEPLSTDAQRGMLGSWEANVAGGAAWLADQGGRQLTVGLAAMPSLHTGASFLFLMFAAKRSPVLTGLLTPLFLFITIDAVANRWHYVIDLPVGIGCALLALYLARRFAGEEASASTSTLIEQNDVGQPAPVPENAGAA